MTQSLSDDFDYVEADDLDQEKPSTVNGYDLAAGVKLIKDNDW